MARIVCGIAFQTKKGTKAARRLQSFLSLSFLLALLWVVHSLYYLSYLSIPAFVFAAGVLASIAVCYYGASSRDASALHAFHIMTVLLTLCMGCIFLIVFVTFVGMDAQQYVSGGWKNWNLTLTPALKKLACTDKLPESDPASTSPGAGSHQQDPIPLGCDFYYNMREQQLWVFLIVSVVAAMLSCLTCVLAFQMYEVIGGPQADPQMEHTLGTAANRLESLLSNECEPNDVEASFGREQIMPRDKEDAYLLN